METVFSMKTRRPRCRSSWPRDEPNARLIKAVDRVQEPEQDSAPVEAEVRD
jgi:hypothetical protein